MDREYYMNKALELAKEAFDADEVPVGCVVVNKEGEIIGTGRNRREETNDACSHAELEAISEACGKQGDWRLNECSIFVTLEPCPMCAGGIINSRIPNVIYGAKDENTGSCGSVINLFEERYGHKPAVYGGVKADECGQILKRFFEKRR